MSKPAPTASAPPVPAAPAGTYVEVSSGSEIVKPKGLIKVDTAANFKFVGEEAQPIKSSRESQARFKSEGKTTWLLPISVNYPNGEKSSCVYADGFAIDCMHHTEKMDFVHIGIPQYIAAKAINEVAAARGIQVQATYTGGYLWVTCKIESIKNFYIMGKNPVEKVPRTLISEMHRSGLNPVGFAVVTMRLKCTCSEGMGAEEVMRQTWTVGASINSFYAYSNTEESAPTLYGGKKTMGARLPKSAQDIELSAKLQEFVSGGGYGVDYAE